MIKGVDVSNYSGVPTVEQVECWRAAGIRFVIIGLQHAGIARLQQAQLLGFDREYYVDRPGRDLSIAEGGARVWIDIELGCFTTRRESVEERHTLEALGLRPGVYGNKTSIRPVIGDSTEFSDLPLWVADYRSAVPDFDAFEPFCGWARPLIWQYAGSTDLCGINVDLNVKEGDEMPTFGPWWLNEDGSQRIEGRGAQIVLVNGGVDVLVIGDETGGLRGQTKKLFGPAYYWLRSNLKTGRAYWSKQQGD